jgi:hypothetical protein
MIIAADRFDRKKKLLEESYVLIERMKRLRALNCDPRIVGIRPEIVAANAGSLTSTQKKLFR